MRPIRTTGSVEFITPDECRQQAKPLWCADHYFADVRSSRADLAEPPSAGELFWRHAQTSDLTYLPSLRGAIMTPRLWPIGAASLTPASSGWAAGDWYDPSTAPTEDWAKQVHETRQVEVARYHPDSPASGYVRTTAAMDGNSSLGAIYQLAAPVAATEGVAGASGLRLYWGIATTGVGLRAAYYLDKPTPNADEDSSQWIYLWRWSEAMVYELVDRWPQPASATADQQGAAGSERSLQVLNVEGRLVLRCSDLGGEEFVHVRPGGTFWQAGCLGAEVYGCSGWVLPCRVLYPTTATVYGPWRRVNPALASAEAKLIATSPADEFGDALCSYTYSIAEATSGGVTRQQARVTVTNGSPSVSVPPWLARSGRLQTPVLWNFQEIHRAELEVGVDQSPVELASYVRQVTINYPDGMRGHTARLLLRNWSEDPGTHAVTLGGLDSILVGAGALRITFTHQYPDETEDGDPEIVFDGIVTRVNFDAVDERGRPAVEVEAMDRTWLWQDGRRVCLDVCDLSGWEWQEAMTLLLQHGEVETTTDVDWPTDYPVDGWYLPFVGGGAAGKLGPGADLVEALDAVCERAPFRWGINPDGTVWTDWEPADTTATDYTVDPDETDPALFAFLPAQHSRDYSQIRNVVRVRGRTIWGHEVEATAEHARSIDESTSNLYVGRRLERVLVEPDNTEPDKAAQRLLSTELPQGLTVEWGGYGQPLYPRDVVQWEAPNTGTILQPRAVIIGKESTWTAAKPVWMDRYTARMLFEDGA